MHGRVRTPPLVLAAAALAAAGCAQVRGTAEAPAVTRLELEGARSFDADEILERIATQESEGPPPLPILGPLLHQLELVLELPPDPPPARVPIVGPVVRAFRLAVGGVDVHALDQDALAVDRRRIEAWYRERGYYSARVEDVVVTPDGDGRVQVLLRVDEGKPVRVARVEVRGLDGAPEALKLAGDLPLSAGDVFTVQAYDATRAALEAALRRTGWATGTVTQSAQVLPEEGSAEVVFEAKPGPRLRVGPLFVAGSSAVRRELIREQAELELKTGEWFDERKLARAQARVFDLGVFAGVRVTRGEPDAARAAVPIVVAVREAPFRTVRIGPGLGLEAARWDASVQAGWTHRNFYGDVRRVSVGLRAGWAWIPTPFGPEKEGLAGLLTFDFSQPAVLFGRVDALAKLEFERGLEHGYDFWSERFRLGAPVRIGSGWSFVPSYNLEVYQLSGVVDAASTDDNSLLDNCESSVCLLSYLEQRLAWDGRDDLVNTRRGLYVSLSVQEGFALRGTGYRYLRFLPEARGFVPLGGSLVLAGRARFGGLIPIQEAGEPPPIARFYGGGPASMRGYDTRQFSRFERRLVNGKERWVATGANGIADASIELRFDVGKSWGGAVFFDGGAVSDTNGRPTEYLVALDPAQAQFAAGVGARYRTAFGPLRLDLAVRLPTDLSADVPFNDRFPYAPHTDGSDGRPSHREKIAAVHLSLGEAF